MKELEFKTMNFYGDKIEIVAHKDGQVFVGIESILRGLGLNSEQIKFHLGKWLMDDVIGKGIQAYCNIGESSRKYYLTLQKLPYGLATMNQKTQNIPRTPECIKKIAVYKNELDDFIRQEILKIRTSEKELVTSPTDKRNSLSREEFAAFMLYEEKHIDTMEKTITGFIQNQTSVMQSFINMQSEFQKAFQNTVLSALSNANTTALPKNPERLSDAEWISNIPEENRKINKLRVVYTEMKLRGVDLAVKKSEYTAKTQILYPTYLNVIAADDGLRRIFEECAEDILSGKAQITRYCEKHEHPANTPQLLQDKVSPLVFEGESTRATLRRIYSEIETKLDCDLGDLLKEYRKTSGCRYASIGYMIVNSKELMDTFDEVVKELL